jgi:hypothetical protein
MFRTFAPAEPGGDKLAVWQLSGIYDYGTFDELLGMQPVKKDEISRKANLLKARVVKMETKGIHVPQDCKTLKDAVELVEWYTGRGKYHKYANTFNEKRFSKIVLGKGKHQIDLDFLEISSAMNIVGDPSVTKSEIVVVGGIKFVKGIQGNCHLQHLTLRQAEECGVDGRSSFTMDDVLVEQCEGCGVRAYGTGVVGRLTNVEIRQCGEDGVVANRSAITLNDVEVHHCGLDGVRAIRGAITLTGKTKVHHNCTEHGYGLHVCTDDATIQLVSPLTKEQVSYDNHENYNWGANGGSGLFYVEQKDIEKYIKTIGPG